MKIAERNALYTGRLLIACDWRRHIAARSINNTFTPRKMALLPVSARGDDTRPVMQPSTVDVVAASNTTACARLLSR